YDFEKSFQELPTPKDVLANNSDNAPIDIYSSPGSVISDPTRMEGNKLVNWSKLNVPWMPNTLEFTVKEQQDIQSHAEKCLGWYQGKLAERYSNLMFQHVEKHQARYNFIRDVSRASHVMTPDELEEERARQENIYLTRKRKSDAMIERLE
ncbi:hypothetical protein BGZ76_003819, partial [Entomortierella beljakovae]